MASTDSGYRKVKTPWDIERFRTWRDNAAATIAAAMVGARGPMATARTDGREVARGAYDFVDSLLAEADLRNMLQDEAAAEARGLESAEAQEIAQAIAMKTAQLREVRLALRAAIRGLGK